MLGYSLVVIPNLTLNYREVWDDSAISDRLSDFFLITPLKVLDGWMDIEPVNKTYLE